VEPWKRNLYSLWTVEFLAVLGMALVLPFLPFYIRELGARELEDVKRWSGFIYAAPFFLAVFTGPLWGWMGDRYGRRMMLIRAVFGVEVPADKLPRDLGIVVNNVATLVAIADYFDFGMPLIERIVTVTGRGIKRPSNLIVPVGTKLRDLLDACGGLKDDAFEIVFGGPMMGAAQADLDTPILKGTTGVVVLAESEVKAKESHPCIRCGHCLDACPVFLNPQLLGSLAKAERWEEMEANHLMDCMLCGCCSYTCPSNIPLSQLFQLAKAALRRRKAA